MRSRAFTLIEILLVLVIVALIVGFGVPNYNKSVLKARARNALHNLSVIHAANDVYKVRNGANNTFSTIDAINTGLHINVIESGATYTCAVTCTYNSVTGPCCQATSAGGSTEFQVKVALNSSLVEPGAGVTNLNPFCSGTYCP